MAIDPNAVLCVILGGGGGSGLFPLTRDRSTPAVPLAGGYRLVDVPISNCVNSGFRQIYILTQYNSASLHRHVTQAYKFDQFSSAFIEILAAEQTLTECSWYQGTADAVRKNLPRFLTRDFEYALILSSDQLYRQDFRSIIAQHAQSGADITVGTVAVPRSHAQRLGLLQADRDGRVERFAEKPKEPALLESLRLQKDSLARLGIEENAESFLASMGIYVFSRGALQTLLDNPHPDFGAQIIPNAIRSHRVFSYLFKGYWQDVGSIGSFFEANLDLVSDAPRFSFFEFSGPIFCQPLYLPGAKVNGAKLDHVLVSAGCIISDSEISRTVVGLRSLVSAGSRLHQVVSMGCDYYETTESAAAHERLGLPRIGIGRNARIEKTIIDRNARIGNDVVISPAGKPRHLDHEQYFIRDGVVIVPRNGVIPHGTII